MSVRTPIEDETKIHENIGKMAPTDNVLSEYLRQQKPEKEEEQSWKHRRQHGMHHWQIEEVAYIEKSYQWVHKAGLIDST